MSWWWKFVLLVHALFFQSEVVSFKTLSLSKFLHKDTNFFFNTNYHRRTPLIQPFQYSKRTLQTKAPSCTASAQQILSEKYLVESNGFQQLSDTVGSVRILPLSKDVSLSEKDTSFELGDKMFVSDFKTSISPPFRSMIEEEITVQGDRPQLTIRVPQSINPSEAAELKTLYSNAKIDLRGNISPVEADNSRTAQQLCEVFFCEPQKMGTFEKWLTDTVEQLDAAGQTKTKLVHARSTLINPYDAHIEKATQKFGLFQ
jgi:hypothetical protein